jgi:spore maturation protein A
MLNRIWFGLILLAVVVAGGRDAAAGGHAHIEAVTKAAVESAGSAVTLAIGLIGVMSLWMGLMRLAEKGGLVDLLARALAPVMRWLFPDVPRGHPAVGAMVMNMAANMLGVANAATPLGLKAMEELQKLNTRKETATNAMCTFLAINTSSIQLIPATAVAILAANGAREPHAIIGTALLATTVSTVVGITSVKLLEKLPAFRLPPAGDGERAS